MHNTLNIGHRGAKGHLAENTLASFEKALQLGADGVELDVHLSADGKIVVIHDDSIDRTTNGNGLVGSMGLDVLQSFTIDSRFHIPELSEVFDLVARRGLINVELKVAETAIPVVALIERYVLDNGWKYTDFLISSFDWLALEQVRDLHAEIPIGVLTSTDLDLAIAFSQVIRAETIHPYYHLLTQENVARMQQQNLKVFAWTVNEFEDLQRIRSFGVNGIITDFPDRL